MVYRSAKVVTSAVAFVGVCWVAFPAQAAPDEDKLGKREGYLVAIVVSHSICVRDRFEG
jgi:hypothetical protein